MSIIISSISKVLFLSNIFKYILKKKLSKIGKFLLLPELLFSNTKFSNDSSVSSDVLVFKII